MGIWLLSTTIFAPEKVSAYAKYIRSTPNKALSQGQYPEDRTPSTPTHLGLVGNLSSDLVSDFTIDVVSDVTL